jgi:tetratricopeptide (TPR) repeat protein
MTKASLDELSAKARRAADDALAAAPEDAAAVRSKIDAARIAGDRDAARALVTRVIGNATQPETAYVLAALDLAEPEPLWPMVIERLRLAASGEGAAGRARAALVYALARSGDAAGAKQELERLATARPSPLVTALRAYVAKAPAAKGDAGVATATLDVSALPKRGGAGAAAAGGGGGGGAAAAAGGGGGGGAGGGGGFAGAADPRNLLAQAASAERTRDYDRARSLYSAALAQNPSDSEALAGLGDVAHAMRDLPGAIGYYKRALAVNPVYLPALVGEGDAMWESGDQTGAQKVYRDIADRFPEGTYPPRVRQRGEGASPAAAPATASTGDQGTTQ